MKQQTTARQVLYKGIMVPAKTMDIGKGKTKLVPISTNQHVLYGIPFPNNLKVTDEIITTARKIVDTSKNTSENTAQLLIRYIRKGRDGYRLGSRAIGKEDIEYFVTRGEPYGVVVAFLHNGKLKIGWSKRLEGFKKEIKSELDNFGMHNL